MSEHAVKNLVFLEFVDEAELFLRRFGSQLKSAPDAFKIISFHPKVKAFLQSRQIGSLDSYLYCPTSSHQILLEKLNDWTMEIRKKCVLEDTFGVRNSYTENLIFFLRTILSTWLYRVEVSRNALRSYKPETTICFGAQKMEAVKSGWTESCERYMTDIFTQQQGALDFQMIAIPDNVWWYRRRFNFGKHMKQLLSDMLGFIANFFIAPRGDLILTPTDEHSMPVILRDLKAAYPKCDVAVLYKPRKAAVKKFADSLSGKGDFRYLFVNPDRKRGMSREFAEKVKIFSEAFLDTVDSWEYAGIRPNEWIRQKYNSGLKAEVIERTYSQASNLHTFLTRWRTRFIVAPHARAVTAVLGEIANSLKIPSLMIPHGSFTPTDDRHAAMEWRENALGMVNTAYRYLALQTPLIENYIKDHAVGSRPVITGPLILGRICIEKEKYGALRREFVNGSEKILLHAGTPKHRNNQRFLNYETIDEYIAGIESLIKAAQGVGGIHVIIRYREIDGLTREELESLLPRSPVYSIASQGNFADYLSITDLLVSYSSTTMEEALQNDIPVLVANPYNQYQHLTGTVISCGSRDLNPSAIYNVNSDADLQYAIQWILDNHLNLDKDWSQLFKKYRYSKERITRIPEIIGTLQ